MRILDLTRLFPFGYGTQFLADLGAEVIKVEQPGGETGRSFPAQFAATNRGKSSVVLDLKQPDARVELLRLAATVDVVVESFRPGYLDSLELGYEALSARRPDLVLCSVTGYARTSPSGRRPGHDLNYLAQAGGVLPSGAGRPWVPAVPVVDVAVASHMCMSIAAALLNVARGGAGCHVEIAMADIALSLNTSNLTLAAESGADRGVPYPEFVLGEVPCYRLWRTADARWVAACNVERKFWLEFLEIIGRPDLSEHQYAVGVAATRVNDEIAAVIAHRTAGQWEELFAGQEVCFSQVLSPEEALASDEFSGRGLVRILNGLPEVLYPATFDGRRPGRSTVLAAPGQDAAHLMATLDDRTH